MTNEPEDQTEPDSEPQPVRDDESGVERGDGLNATDDQLESDQPQPVGDDESGVERGDGLSEPEEHDDEPQDLGDQEEIEPVITSESTTDIFGLGSEASASSEDDGSMSDDVTEELRDAGMASDLGAAERPASHDPTEEQAAERPESGDFTEEIPPSNPASSVPHQQPMYPVPLLRDSSRVLGGVASGVAKRYGLDISLVRLGMVLLAFTGIGILIYLAAWIIIPKAASPLIHAPVRPEQTQKFLGVALAGSAVLLAVAGAGSGGGIIVTLALLGSGVWLLARQSPSTGPSVSGPSGPGVGQNVATGHGVAGSSSTTHGVPGNSYYGVSPYPPPVVAKSRTGLKVLGGTLAVLAAFLMLGIGAVAAVVSADPDVYFNADDDGVYFTSGDEDRLIEPATIEDIPVGVFDAKGTLTVDLTNTRLPVRNVGDPTESTIGLARGTLEVIIPEGLDIRFETSVGRGSIEYSGQVFSGTDLSQSFGPENASVILDLNVAKGDIIIVEE